MSTQLDTGVKIHGRVYNGGKTLNQHFSLSEVSELLEQEGNVVWVDLTDPGPEDLNVMVDELGLHPLSVEDALHPHQRAKVDRYEHHLFVTLYMVSLDEGADELTTTEVNVFVTKNAMVTVHRSSQLDLGAIERQWSGSRHVATHGVAVLLHGLMDYAVDEYFRVVQALDEKLDGLEDVLFDDDAPANEVQRQSFAARKSLVALRRVVLPMREVVTNVLRNELELIDREMFPYYQDVYDHVLRVSEWVDSLRDLVSTVLETNLSIQSNRLNDVMRKLTAWTVIVAVPTAVTGYFGQNVPYPGSGQAWGFAMSTIVLLAVAATLASAFRAKRWL